MRNPEQSALKAAQNYLEPRWISAPTSEAVRQATGESFQPGDPELSPAAVVELNNAASGMMDALIGAHLKRVQVEAVADLSPSLRAARVLEVQHESLEPALAKMESAVASVDTAIEAARKKISERSEPSDAGDAREVRAVLRRLPTQGREDFLHRARESGDLNALAAVAAADPAVSGVDPETWARIRRELHARAAPEATRALAALEAVRARLDLPAMWIARAADEILPPEDEEVISNLRAKYPSKSAAVDPAWRVRLRQFSVRRDP